MNSLQNILSLLTKKEYYRCPAMVHSYALFLYHVYLDTDYDFTRMPSEQTVIDMTIMPDMWTAMQCMCDVASDSNNWYNELRLFVFEGALPCLRYWYILSFLTLTDVDCTCRKLYCSGLMAMLL